MKHYLRYSLFFFSLLLLGCKGEICKDLDIVETTATLIWNGEYSLDGCGYSVQIGEKQYKPENESDIDDSFKTQELFTGTTVNLAYSPRGRRLDVACGMLPATTSIDYIHVISVEKL